MNLHHKCARTACGRTHKAKVETSQVESNRNRLAFEVATNDSGGGEVMKRELLGLTLFHLAVKKRSSVVRI
jgi:hypothetical protein